MKHQSIQPPAAAAQARANAQEEARATCRVLALAVALAAAPFAAGAALAAPSTSAAATTPDPQPPSPPADAADQPGLPTPVAPTPVTPNPEVDQIVKDLEQAATRRTPIGPTIPPSTRSPTPGGSALAPRLLREGTFLSNRRGRVSRNDRGESLITFDADAQGRAEPPMMLHPTQNLASAQRLIERSDVPVTLIVSGQVFAYHGRNFLLLSRPAEVVRAATASTGAPTSASPGAAAPGAGPAGPQAKPARVSEAERVMAELEQGAAGPGPRTETIRPETAREERITAAAVREGAFIASRRGRMVRSATGAWTFAFDTDPESKGDLPMTLLPCVNLMAMEEMAQRSGEALSLTVSGQVLSQNGRTYLLPTMYVVQPRTAK